MILRALVTGDWNHVVDECRRLLATALIGAAGCGLELAHDRPWHAFAWATKTFEYGSANAGAKRCRTLAAVQSTGNCRTGLMTERGGGCRVLPARRISA